MNRTAIIVAIAAVLAGVVFVAYKFGFMLLIRITLGAGFALLALVMIILTGILIYAKSKYFLLSLIFSFLALYAVYYCYLWQPFKVLAVIAVYGISLILGVWWLSEPDMGFWERIKSARSLEMNKNYRAAARKYEKAGNYEKAAECYSKSKMKESAAWCYEKAGNYEKAAKIYEELAEERKESYYWKEASEHYIKAGRRSDAARCLAKYAEEEPMYWEDVAKIYEEIGEKDKAEESWKNALEYYKNEAEEEGVFWEDVAKIQEKLGEMEKAKESWKKYLEYCLNEAKKDGAWWKHVAEAYEKLGDIKEAEKARKMMAKS
ncbi:MAG: GlcNAc transferase [Archaeoglobus sp.]|nr:MAG: GlcNAc transferase [Archaeoglobus sp.]